MFIYRTTNRATTLGCSIWTPFAQKLSSQPATRQLTSAAESEVFSKMKFKTLSLTVPKPFVYHVELCRPKNYNALNKDMWCEIKDCFDELSNNSDCRVIILSAAGKHFTAGIDLNDMIQLGQELGEIEDLGRKGLFLGKRIKLYQDAFTALEVCTKPVIAAIHSACIGAGVDLTTAADIRYCSEDAWFQVKEVEIGMAADVGTLQRLPKVIGSQSLVRELCLSGRKFLSKEAYECGLVSKIFDTKDAMMNGAVDLAQIIASKSPIAVQATKKNIIYSMDHTNQEGLDQIVSKSCQLFYGCNKFMLFQREMNKLLLQSEDFITATAAQLTKGEKPVFAKL